MRNFSACQANHGKELNTIHLWMNEFLLHNNNKKKVQFQGSTSKISLFQPETNFTMARVEYFANENMQVNPETNISQLATKYNIYIYIWAEAIN